MTAEHWLGNENIRLITNQRNYELRVDLADFQEQSSYAIYDHFRLGDEAAKYTLYLGEYSGTAG